jgi:hypothetical protein
LEGKLSVACRQHHNPRSQFLGTLLPEALRLRRQSLEKGTPLPGIARRPGWANEACNHISQKTSGSCRGSSGAASFCNASGYRRVVVEREEAFTNAALAWRTLGIITKPGSWVDYACRIEEVGGHALELSVFDFIASSKRGVCSANRVPEIEETQGNEIPREERYSLLLLLLIRQR